MPIIPVLWKLRQEDCEFTATLSYIARLCLKQQTNKNLQPGRYFPIIYLFISG
jgi:hypothetical protein